MKKLDLKYFLIILIVVLLGYLIYINYFENKTLESFKVRNSLSSYFQSDDDTDFDDSSIRHELRYTRNDVRYEPSKWNGTYKFSDVDNNNYFVNFLQINKDLLFVINKIDYNIGGSGTTPDPYVINDKNKPQCLPGMLIAKGELNDAEDIFYMKDVYCSNNDSATGGFSPFGVPITEENINQFYGYFNDNGKIEIVQEKLDDSGKEGYAVLDKMPKYKYGPSAEYLLRTSYNVPAPNVKNSIKTISDVCLNSYFDDYNKGELKSCYIGTDGLPTPSDKSDYIDSNNQKYQYNQYGTGCAVKDDVKNVSDGNGGTYSQCPKNIDQTCFIPIKNNEGNQLNQVGDYKKCKTSFDLKINNESSLMYPYYLRDQESGNLLSLCNHLDGFQSKKYNAAIVMYVDNLSNVETLNFDFFGIDKGQNYLTTKLDIMFPYMNKNILEKLRNNMNDEKSLRLTNCIERNVSVQNYSNLLSKCSGEYNNVDMKYKKLKNEILNNMDKEQSQPFKNLLSFMDNINLKANNDKVNRLLQPTVWKLDFLKKNSTQQNLPDYTNDCSFILSTSEWYTKESRFVKYAEFDSVNNSTKMNLYGGGNKQKVVLENPYILDSLEEKLGTEEYNQRTSNNNNNNISNEYILLCGNLRTYHPKKYLVPGLGNPFNPFGKQIYLQDKVKSSGKWVILGFQLSENLDVGTSTNSYNNTLLKTLKKISDTMNS